MAEINEQELNEVNGGGVIGPDGRQYRLLYVVQPGDNLSTLGMIFGVNYLVIARVNGIVNPDVIKVGQKLYIPYPGVQY